MARSSSKEDFFLLICCLYRTICYIFGRNDVVTLENIGHRGYPSSSITLILAYAFSVYDFFFQKDSGTFLSFGGVTGGNFVNEWGE